jgi:hypothetical protein
MLSKKIFKWVHSVALFAIFFASLAPSISHALAAQQGVNSFAQEICTADGENITIDVVTSQGHQLSTTLLDQEETPSPASIVHHLNHCPFCSNPNADHGIDAPNLPIIALLETQAKQLVVSTQAALLPRFSVLPPPAQAPPAFN